jgi:hypothetical protein
MCNFLTNEEITERFQAEIRAITRSLTPGGLFVVLGSAGSQYASVYEKLQRIVATSRLRRLRKFDQPLRAHVDEWNRRLIGSQIRGDVAFSSSMAPLAFSEIMGKLPKDVVDLAREIDFPQFRVHVWKNEWFRRRGKGRQESSEHRRKIECGLRPMITYTRVSRLCRCVFPGQPDGVDFFGCWLVEAVA